MLLQFGVQAVLHVGHDLGRGLGVGPAEQARAATECPPLSLFDEADFCDVVESFDCQGNPGPIFAVPQVSLKGTKGPSRHGYFKPRGVDQACGLILPRYRTIFDCVKCSFPGMVVAADGESFLHTAQRCAGGQESGNQEDAESAVVLCHINSVGIVQAVPIGTAWTRNRLEVRGCLD